MSDAGYKLPTEGADKEVDLEEIDFGGGVLRYRGRGVIASPSNKLARADVVNTEPAGTEYGLVVRIAGSMPLDIGTIVDDFTRELGQVQIDGSVAVTHATNSEVDGHSATLGATADADTALTVIGRLKKIVALLSGTLTASVVATFGTQDHDFTTTGAHTAVNASAAPPRTFSLQVTGDGTTTTWSVTLEGSNDNATWSVLTTHNATLGSFVFAVDKPVLYWRVNCGSLTLGDGTKITTHVLAVP